MSAASFLPPLTAIAGVADPAPVTAALQAGTVSAAAAGNGFSDMVVQGLSQVNSSLLASQVDMQQLASGDTSNLHQVMIRMEESRLSFQLMLQVRNHLLESYQEVMRMQV